MRARVVLFALLIAIIPAFPGTIAIRAATPDAVIRVDESVGVMDGARAVPPISIVVDEVVAVAESPQSVPPRELGVNEAIRITDQAIVTPPMVLRVDELVGINDGPRALPPIALRVDESVSVVDAQRIAPPLSLRVDELIGVFDTARISPPLSIRVDERLAITDGPSVVLSVAPQTITFAPLPDRDYGEPDFSVSATASSSLTVVFTAAGACTISGALVHLVAPGTCSITASQPGNASFQPAQPVARSFRVRSATDQLSATVAIIRGYGLPDGTATSLIAKLAQTRASLESGSLLTACNQVSAFENEVRAQRGKKLSSAQTDELLARAARIRYAAGCPPGQ